MKYKDIDLSQIAFYFVSEELAKEVIDWRLKAKKPMTQRVFDNALKKALECQLYGWTAEEALERWVESGWSGIKYVVEEAKREQATRATTLRTRTVAEDLTDVSWAE